MRSPALATLVVVGTIASLVNSQQFLSDDTPPSEKEFSKFMGKYQRSYKDKEEYELRMDIFIENHRKIVEHNSKEGVSFKLGVN